MLSQFETDATRTRIEMGATLVSSGKHAHKAEPEEQPDSDAETEKDFNFTTGISSLHHMADEEEGSGGEKSTVDALVKPWTSVHSSRAAHDAALFWGTLYSPPAPMLRPARVLCVARRYNRKDKYVDFVGEYHLDLIQEFGGAPIMVPRTVGTLSSLLEYLPMDGLLVVEGNDISDDVLRKYQCSIPQRLEGEAAEKFASDTEFDISKDELECALMRLERRHTLWRSGGRNWHNHSTLATQWAYIRQLPSSHRRTQAHTTGDMVSRYPGRRRR